MLIVCGKSVETEGTLLKIATRTRTVSVETAHRYKYLFRITKSTLSSNTR